MPCHSPSPTRKDHQKTARLDKCGVKAYKKGAIQELTSLLTFASIMKLTPLLAIAASTALLLVDTILAAPTATVSDVEVDVVKAHSKKVITG